MSGYAARKRQLRAELKTMRDAMDETGRVAIDNAIAQNVRSLPAWRVSRVVYAYLSFGSEVDTRRLLCAAWEEGKQVALPRCVPHTHDMHWHLVESLDGLKVGPYRILEPVEGVHARIDDAGMRDYVALVPGLSFSQAGYRMGYGGGFYDKFLVSFSGTSIGLCRDAFLGDEFVVREAHDLPVQIVVTEHEALLTNTCRDGREGRAYGKR